MKGYQNIEHWFPMGNMRGGVPVVLRNHGLFPARKREGESGEMITVLAPVRSACSDQGDYGELSVMMKECLSAVKKL